MRTLSVSASSDYLVEIAPGLLDALGERTVKLLPRAQIAVIVSDEHVFPLHGERAHAALAASGFTVLTYIVPPGEATKNPGTLISLLSFLAENRVARTDVLVALGGGMVGDLTGFAAAVYMRGVAYIQCPTTLLAAADSSVGGKTAVDLPEGKNLMGAFWQPGAVLCDTGTLGTLPAEIFSDGCAEVVKTALLFDTALFSTLCRTGPDFDREDVIARCVAHKRDVVASDEFDTGTRALLNLGHTLGHAVEACSGYRLSHGRSVAVGTAVVCRAAARAGLCDPGLPRIVESLLASFGLPTNTELSMSELLPVMLSDKKRSADRVKVIVPRRVGKSEIRPMTADELRDFMEGGLST